MHSQAWIPFSYSVSPLYHLCPSVCPPGHCPMDSPPSAVTPSTCFPILELQGISAWPPLSSAFFAYHFSLNMASMLLCGAVIHSFSLLHSIPQAGFQHVALPPIARAFSKKGLLVLPRSSFWPGTLNFVPTLPGWACWLPDPTRTI